MYDAQDEEEEMPNPAPKKEKKKPLSVLYPQTNIIYRAPKIPQPQNANLIITLALSLHKVRPTPRIQNQRSQTAAAHTPTIKPLTPAKQIQAARAVMAIDDHRRHLELHLAHSTPVPKPLPKPASGGGGRVVVVVVVVQGRHVVLCKGRRVLWVLVLGQAVVEPSPDLLPGHALEAVAAGHVRAGRHAAHVHDRVGVLAREGHAWDQAGVDDVYFGCDVGDVRVLLLLVLFLAFLVRSRFGFCG